jgi:hypothetical protein
VVDRLVTEVRSGKDVLGNSEGSNGGQVKPTLYQRTKSADPVASVLGVLLGAWNEAQDASQLRKGLLALLTAIDS